MTTSVLAAVQTGLLAFVIPVMKGGSPPLQAPGPLDSPMPVVSSDDDLDDAADALALPICDQRSDPDDMNLDANMTDQGNDID
jgi:hypothetical protein